ncbi:hypothetical protein T265_10593 [Opisthorchis viverrini]|uniref:Uncharacterized protein n=1 Tax=Opisthorchis viverrini TaxID=6198 RepID=A0A074Z602_OPIVI|nr:hypothetical protein T265_10593 [Opisthorchis viverrini]KER20982.1 hypothetical protein T265_10593 [Opisthorchis viverrini]
MANAIRADFSALAETDKFEETRMPKSFLASTFMMFSGPYHAHKMANAIRADFSWLAEETRWNEADMGSQFSGSFGDPVVVDHKSGGLDNGQSSRPNLALPKFKAWKDEGVR